MKVRPTGAELFHGDGLADRGTDRHDSRFSQFGERT